jgi:phosphoribosylaminoimidazole (AIR) synthetase
MRSAPGPWSMAGAGPATACGVAWGGGETPALAGIVEAGRIDLAASCTGIVNPKSRLTLGERWARGTPSCCWRPAASMPTA